jgi:hypothetical protein
MDKPERIWNVTAPQSAAIKPAAPVAKPALVPVMKTRDAWICCICAILVVVGLIAAASVIVRSLLR